MLPQSMKVTIFAAALLTIVSQTYAGAGVRVGVGYRSGHRAAFVSHIRFGGPVYPYYAHHHRHVTVVPGNFGRVDFNVVPKESEVYVDGTFIGTADDFNGGFFGTTATFRAGRHRVKVVAPDGRVVHRKIYVMPGKELDLDIRF